MVGKDSFQPSVCEQRLLSISAEAVRGATELARLLREEYAALRQSDVAALQNIAAPKHELVARLEHLGSQLRQAFGHMGIAFDTRSSADWVSATDDPVLQDTLRELNTLLAACRYQNRTNGALLEALRKHTQRAIQLLTGESDCQAVYSALGESQPLVRSRYTATV